MTEHLALFLRLHCREQIVRLDAAWRKAMCWSLGHEWRTEPYALRVSCARCEEAIHYRMGDDA
jgi:hypothetical protein